MVFGGVGEVVWMEEMDMRETKQSKEKTVCPGWRELLGYSKRDDGEGESLGKRGKIFLSRVQEAYGEPRRPRTYGGGGRPPETYLGSRYLVFEVGRNEVPLPSVIIYFLC